ncbi:NAD-dependent epimerase/dehydratase family protein [Spiribacter sp. 218]|uniref:NAD-dependent epimerase/dehydratase family protein n=1 Tax=Spiribacter pallidus TaxID=1987936 RepID=UPI00349FBB30
MITGGAGFIGTSIARHLSGRGYRVSVIDSDRRLQRIGEWPANVEPVAAEIAQPASWREPLRAGDTLIHLRYSSHGDISATDCWSTVCRHLETEGQLFAAAIERGARRIVYASSGGAIYGRHARGVLTEEQATAPLSTYGCVKACSEACLDRVAHTADVPALALRIGNPVGPFQFNSGAAGLVATAIRAAITGQSLPVFGAGDTVRDYLWIDDLAAAFVAAVETPGLPGGPYNVGSGEGWSVRDALSVVERVIGRPVPTRNERPRAGDAPAVILDSRALREATGWRTRLDLPEIVQRMWAAAD